MNTGVIASRYARALLKLVTETGRGEQVYAQVKSMLDTPEVIPQPLEQDIQSLVQLLVRKGRIDHLVFVLRSFVGMYEESHHIMEAQLITPVPAPELEKKLTEVMQKKFNCEILLHSSVDPSIVGGFVLDIDDYRVDASVSSQLKRLRAQFEEKNTRIV